MKISQKTGLIVAAGIFLALLAVGLIMRYDQAQKKGKESIFDLEVPEKNKK